MSERDLAGTAIILVAAGLAAFSPAAALAQVVTEAPGDKRAASQAESRSPTVAEKLNRRLDVDFVDTPLQDVLDFLSNTSGVQFYVNRKRLEESGIAVDTPVSKSLKQVRLSTILDITLGELDLLYLKKDDLLVITTREDADVNSEVRVYDCRDLLAMPAPLVGKTEPAAEAAEPAAAAPAERGGFNGFAAAKAAPPSVHELRAQRLMNIITTAVEPQSWQEVGGFGTISEYNGLIVVSQSARTHAKIEKVLDMLRQAAGLEKPRGGSVVR